MEAVDCQPDFCLDLFEPSGHGRRRRAIADHNKNHTNSLTDYTRFKENIEYSVLLPGDYDQMKYQDDDQCKSFILISGLLALLLTLSTILVSTMKPKFYVFFEKKKFKDFMKSINFYRKIELLLNCFSLLLNFLSFQSCSLVTKIQNFNRKTIDDYIPSKGYAGRAVLQ